MGRSHQVKQFVKELSTTPNSGKPLFNPWFGNSPYDSTRNAAAIRRLHLTEYLQARPSPRLVLIAEAPGYQGCRFSGIPMTSERMLLNFHDEIGLQEVLPRRNRAERTSKANANQSKRVREEGFTEPTATIVWTLLVKDQRLSPLDFVLWNAVPWHPHKRGRPLTNRPPTAAELRAGGRHIQFLLGLFPSAGVVAVGKKAQSTCEKLGVEAGYARHPANGGATEFRDDIQRHLRDKRSEAARPRTSSRSDARARSARPRSSAGDSSRDGRRTSSSGRR